MLTEEQILRLSDFFKKEIFPSIEENKEEFALAGEKARKWLIENDVMNEDGEFTKEED